MRDDDFILPVEDRDLMAALAGMFAGIALFKKHGYDPVEMCQMLCDDDNNERVIGRRLFPESEANDKAD